MYGTRENPLFLAKDVAEWIEHTNPTLMVNSVDEEEKKLDYVIDSSGQRRKATFLTEDGLYEILMQSRKPIAKQFKKEIKKILKEIRLTGGYLPVNEDDTEGDIVAKALIIAQNRIELKEKELEQANKQNKQLKDIAEKYQEKAEAYTTMFDKKGFTVKSVANAIGIEGLGQNNLFKYLSEIGWSTKNSPREPIQTALNNGYVTGIPCSPKKGYSTHCYTKIILTEKGIRKLHKKLINDLGIKEIKSVEEIMSTLS
ncbi:BRO family protein [Haloimpatiens sp. FM7330]|uniref:BRO family protein n=1 Tax=Haloimpatiens sp. FM7330 TaxID=3298610 RepID=UPI0036422B1B